MKQYLQQKATRPPARLATVPAIMSTITVDEIERDPQAFLNRMESGEMLLVVKGTRTVAEIKPVPVRGTPSRRPYGLCAGQFVTPADFDAPLPDDILEEFERA